MTRVAKDKTKMFKNLKYKEHIICSKIKKKYYEEYSNKVQESYTCVRQLLQSLYDKSIVVQLMRGRNLNIHMKHKWKEVRIVHSDLLGCDA